MVPLMSVYQPAFATQDALPAADAVFGAHEVQRAAPAAEYFPAGHTKQVLPEV